MEAKKEEALKEIQNAEKRFAQRDFVGAKSYALKAQTLCPEFEGISRMVTTFEVHIASQVTCNGELDCYSILGLKPSANIEAVKRQYKKMAGLLHPDKNKCVGADGAFKLVSEAWTRLSSSYDTKRNAQLGAGHGLSHKDLSSGHASGGNRRDTFWTICTSCKVQYEYLRKYINKKLSCKNCRGTFIAVETAPANGSFPYSPWSYGSGSGHGSHSYDGLTYVPTSGTYLNGNGVTGYHSGPGYEYVSNVPYQWSSVGYVNQNGSTKGSGKVKPGADRKHYMTETAVSMNSDVSFSRNELQEVKLSRPEKKRKVVGASLKNVHEGKGSKCASVSALANGNESVGHRQRLSSTSEVPTKQYSMVPAFDARKLLMEKARTVIRKKLEEIKLSSETAAAVNERKKSQADVGQVKRDTYIKTVPNVSNNQLEHRKTGPVTITVPDSDFHDFDKDRSEPCFKPKQIWALYDEEDGMPRLYCLIREVVSVNPFKVNISYLSSKTDSEFGEVNWLVSGFTKSCGNFRAMTADVVDQVNIFSHVLSKVKAGRGGCVRIYPKCGEIWAVYRNWSTNWNRSTPDEVRHQYDMVEVLDDYSEELGICASPLIKLDGFKTVYKTDTDKNAIRWIPRKEMVRFSHQVPSWLLKGEEASNLPDRCWDLDPAATPDELLHAAIEAKAL
ncbi:uncharacterized protein [Cicer arietinum]|uniref:Uncharacterized protein LOC101490298 n=1 Tax=Cicer arietinum TaxID=3827 RepID=A0A1S2YAZ5_CICAR|nr:uncharacterized protein LOC101490298 [Cicer arietinum]XP_004502155.1 uncharacterized protein LOC101490298 [Cicer arietinum]XP_004502156.1 uncharacterized protein LOC101490298 [Cicer arietinum]